jgi:hypothetical protein
LKRQATVLDTFLSSVQRSVGGDPSKIRSRATG